MAAPALSQSSRVSVLQLEKLLDFLESHEDLALGHCRSKEGRQRSKKLWDEVASTLNSTGDGAIKDGTGWSKYWTIFKNRLKTKLRTDRAARHQTGGGPSNVVYTPLEERVLGIIGGDAGAPLSGVQVNPLQSQETGVAQDIVVEELIDPNFYSDIGFVDEDPQPGPSTAPVTPPPLTAPVTPRPSTAPGPPAAPRPIRRQRTRPRLHSVSEAREDLLRIEEGRVAAEARNAEYLQQIPPALNAIAVAILELAAVFRQQHHQQIP